MGRQRIGIKKSLKNGTLSRLNAIELCFAVNLKPTTLISKFQVLKDYSGALHFFGKPPVNFAW